ncbi:hypothetical protein D3C72_2324510 [compost metagenome]
MNAMVSEKAAMPARLTTTSRLKSMRSDGDSQRVRQPSFHAPGTSASGATVSWPLTQAGRSRSTATK